LAGQLESPHFLRLGDIVARSDGAVGTVVDASSLYAIVAWDAREPEEVDQFDPRVLVIQRAEFDS
jgi:hypothetical protein